MNPAHENEVARIVRELYPDRSISDDVVARDCSTDGRVREVEYRNCEQFLGTLSIGMFPASTRAQEFRFAR